MGRPLGTVVEGDGSSSYQVGLGSEVLRLEAPDAAAWLALHKRGVSRPLPQLGRLLDMGLAVEFAAGDDDARQAFAERFRMLALQPFLGNRPQDLGHFMMGVGTRPTVTLGWPLREVVSHAARYGDLRGVCFVQSGVMELEPETAHLGDPDALVAHVLERAAPLLAVHAIHFDVAIDPYEARAAYEASAGRPREVPVTDDDTTPYGVYALGYPLGAQYMWLGLEAVRLRLGLVVHELPDERAWAVWEDARRGAPAAESDLAEQADRGLIARPCGDRALVEFAAGHRLETLLAGLGNTGSTPGTYHLGIGDAPVTSVPEGAYRVWCDGPRSWTLLDAAHAAGRAGTVEDLRAYLQEVQLLCMRHAAYIDQVKRI